MAGRHGDIIGEGLLALVLAVILLAATALLCNKKKRLGSGSTNNKERNKVSI